MAPDSGQQTRGQSPWPVFAGQEVPNAIEATCAVANGSPLVNRFRSGDMVPLASRSGSVVLIAFLQLIHGIYRQHASVRGQRGGCRHCAGSRQFQSVHLIGVLGEAGDGPGRDTTGTAPLRDLESLRSGRQSGRDRVVGTAAIPKVVPSTHIRCITTAKRRARATIARLRPRRFATRDAHVRSALPRPQFSMGNRPSSSECPRGVNSIDPAGPPAGCTPIRGQSCVPIDSRDLDHRDYLLWAVGVGRAIRALGFEPLRLVQRLPACSGAVAVKLGVRRTLYFLSRKIRII